MARHPRLAYRPDIDGLRAVAVLGVVSCHAGLLATGGFVGVDVFFVISGYLITVLILKDLEGGRFSILEFWERRIRRIVPALLVVVVATLAAGWSLLLPHDLASLGRSIVGLDLIVSNVQFWRETGYFEAAAEQKPLLHTWSLAVEEQFYLFVPIFLLLLSRIKQPRRMFAPMALAAALSFGLSVYGTAHHPSATFYLLPTRAWELLVGVLLAMRPALGDGMSPRLKGPGAALGLASILIPCFLYDETTPFPGLAALPPVLGAALLIASGSGPGRLPFASRLLAWRPMVFVGLISYSLYLWHWPLFAFANHEDVRPISAGVRLLLVAASLVLGVISWRYVETPFRTRRLLGSRPRLLTASGLAFAGLLLVGIGLERTRGLEGRHTPRSKMFADSSRENPGDFHNLEIGDIPGNLVPLGVAGRDVELLVWGDSHAVALLPALDALCKEAGITARAATHSSTAPALGFYVRKEFGLNERAIPFNAAVLEHVRAGKIPRVLMAGAWGDYFRDARFSDALLRTVDSLREAGAAVYFVNDVPGFAFDVSKALALYTWRGWDPSRLRLTLSQHEAANRLEREFLPKLRDRGVTVLDPVPLLRARTGTVDILPFDDNGSFYRDGTHLSAYGALVLKPLFAPAVRRSPGSPAHPGSLRAN